MRETILDPGHAVPLSGQSVRFPFWGFLGVDNETTTNCYFGIVRPSYTVPRLGRSWPLHG